MMSIASTLSPATVLISTLFGLPIYSKRRQADAPAHAILNHLLDNPSAIVLVEGPSGSGKSTLLNKVIKAATESSCLLTRALRQDLQTKARVIDHLTAIMQTRRFDAASSVKEAASLLASCGLGQPALWLRRPRCLSDGEQSRFMIACAISRAGTAQENSPFIVVIDEFLSTLDQITAQATCEAISRLVELRPSLRLLAATAHSDLASFLRPRFVVNPCRGGTQ